MQNHFGRRLPASYRRWREERQFQTWGAIGGAVLALFVVASIVLLKHDGAPKLVTKRAEPATIGQSIPTADPLAPTSIAAPIPRE
jgi:hypothetical protein